MARRLWTKNRHGFAVGTARALLAAVVAASCGVGDRADDADNADVVVRDSAGVRVVEHHADPWAEDVPAWRLVEPPLIDLGVIEGDANYMFYRVTDAVRMPGARIVVLDGGSAELRFFASDGGFIRTVGRQGEGPGEFLMPTAIWRTAGDSIVVFDGQLERLSVFTGTGEFVRVAPLVPSVLNPEVVGALGDRGFLLAAWVLDFQEPGFPMQYIHVYGGTPMGAIGSALGRYPLWRMGPVPSVGMIAGPALQPRTQVAGAGARYYVGTAETHAYEVHAPDGRLTDRVRWTGPDLTVTDAHEDRHREARLAAAETPDAQRHAQRLLDETGFSATLPAYAQFMTDLAGNLWILAFEVAGEVAGADAPARWAILDPAGRRIGRVVMPAGLRIAEIGDDYVLAIARDALDVEHVRLYRLLK